MDRTYTGLELFLIFVICAVIVCSMVGCGFLSLFLGWWVMLIWGIFGVGLLYYTHTYLGV